MKKLKAILLVFLLLMPFTIARGEEVTLENVLKYFKTYIYTGEDDNELNQGFQEEFINKMNFTIKDGYIEISDENGEIGRKIGLNGNTLTYYGNEKYNDKEYRENKENLDEAFGDMLIDFFYINQLTYTATRLKGYSDEEYHNFVNILNSIEDDDNAEYSEIEALNKLKALGVTINYEEYNYEETSDSGHVYMSAMFILSYELDLEKFDLAAIVKALETGTPVPKPNENQNTNEQENPNVDKEVENPKTGLSLPYYLIPIAIVLGCILKSNLNKKKIFHI